MKVNQVDYDCMIAIDPGANGSIVHVRDRIVKSVDMPGDIRDTEKYLRYLKSISTRVFAAIEKQSLWVGDMSPRMDIDDIDNEQLKEKLKELQQKNREQAAKVFRLQKLFENYNGLKMLFGQLEFDFVPVASISWQSTLGLVNRNTEETLTEKKNRHKDMAQATFKTITVTHKNADSLLLLYFILHKAEYDNKWFYDKNGCKIIYAKRELL